MQQKHKNTEGLFWLNYAQTVCMLNAQYCLHKNCFWEKDHEEVHHEEGFNFAI